MPNTNIAQKRLLRFALAMLISVLFIIAVWLMGSYWLLNSQWLPKRISQFEGIEIRWSQGASRHPGRWEVENLYLAREDDALPITIEAERATLHLSLLSLLRGELHINAMDAEGIRRLTVGDIALEAQGTLEVVDTTLSRERLATPRVNLAITGGRLVRLSDQTTLVNAINLEAVASLDEVTPTDPATGELNPELLAALSATLDIQAQADAWDVFMPYLEALPWLSLNGRGALAGHIDLTSGTLEPGSQLVLNAPELHLALDERRLRQPEHPPAWIIADTPPPRHTATGKGSVTLGVNEDRLEFETLLTDVILADTQPYAVDTELSLTSSIANQRLDHLVSPTDAKLTLEGTITRLDMLDRYLADTLQGEGVRLSGNGRIVADISVRDTQAHSGHLWIEAENLAAKALDVAVQGSGTLDAELSDASTLDATLDFSNATLSHFERTLLDNAMFNLTAQSPLDPIKAREQATATLSWHNARLPNINALQPYINTYLPDPAPLRLISGQAQSQGVLSVTREQLSGEIQLEGNALTTRLQRSDQRTTLTSDMQLSLLLNQAATDSTSLDISGSRLRWQVADNTQPGERLESILVLREAHFQRRADTPSGQFKLEGSVQRLGFLNTFLPAAHGVSLSGNGQLFAQGSFRDDRLLAPTRLRINANQLEVAFLDYLATGRGELTAQIDSAEQAQLSLGIPQFALQRKDDERPHVEGRHFELTTQTDQLSKVLATPAPEYFVTRIALPITEVPDFTRYNRYLPESAGITLLGGQASLASEWLLDGLKAQGELSLRAFGADMALLDQRLRGDLHLSLTLTDGDLETRHFTADNSFLRLENITRPNEGISADAGWWVQLSMNKAQLDWAAPVHLVSQVGLEMRDTGLLARLFLERAREKEWLGRLLSVRNISGFAELVINGERASLKDLVLTGGPLLLLSDINLAERRADGALYARLGALGVAVELEDNQPELHIFQPRRWFDRWRQTQSPTLDAPPHR
ncbi:hypothetical protein [Vreelandella populi]|uniref:AsmA-like C-terminal domain-containing protein n=1 Tax=Vreelandella populi TaxID=2498858 RepID=A0A3S0WQG3_9GAMM|nr:hypothetical protein [Halomonas populi]RUR37938.1 hypothetical protein ELY25_10800 [Halomonas populi]RUR48915.1 hypothetical protein ELY37_03450 [Halomonas populi]